MHFGRVPSVEGIELRLPPDAPRTEKFLALPRSGRTRTLVGCPVWASKAWRGEFYPPGTKSGDFLKFYATRFPTVELNSSFYQLLGADRVARWRDQTPVGFRFCPKVFRGITEALGASEMPALIERCADAFRAFGDRLGLTFAQLPEYFGPEHHARLASFLKLWPSDVPLAIEFRHPGWFVDHALLDAAVNLLYRHGVATVITDTAGRRDVLHSSLTQPRVLIRFQGNEGHASEDERLAAWGERIRKWAGYSLEAVYFFVHQPAEARIPETARRAAAALGEALPEVPSAPIAQTLF